MLAPCTPHWLPPLRREEKRAKNNLPDPAALAGVFVFIMAHAYPYTRLVVQDSIAAVSGLGG
jgi:hypothetical protein